VTGDLLRTTNALNRRLYGCCVTLGDHLSSSVRLMTLVCRRPNCFLAAFGNDESGLFATQFDLLLPADGHLSNQRISTCPAHLIPQRLQPENVVPHTYTIYCLSTTTWTFLLKYNKFTIIRYCRALLSL